MSSTLMSARADMSVELIDLRDYRMDPLRGLLAEAGRAGGADDDCDFGFCHGRDSLKTAFRAEALADFRDFRFALVERALARVNGVHAERELVGVLDGRAQDEARVFERF